MLRRAALVLAVVALAWLLSQGCVLAWQAAAAVSDARAYARGSSPFEWHFAQADALVLAGSEGLDPARRDARGLHFEDLVAAADLSLSLHGRRAPLGELTRAELDLDTTDALHIRLLAAPFDADAQVVAEATVAPPGGVTELAIVPDTQSAQVLRLRIEPVPDGGAALAGGASSDSGSGSDSAGRLTLRRLQLLPGHSPCAEGARTGECPAPITTATLEPRATPALFLHARDRALAAHPAAHPRVAGVPDALPLGIGSPDVAARTALLAAVGVLAWATWQRRRRASAHAWQLAVLLALPLAVLLIGLDGPLATLAFVLCCVAALVHPGGRDDWRWRGDARAWRGAGVVAIGGLALIGVAGVLSLLDGEDAGGLRLDRLPRYAAWALLQQALLLVAIAPRMRALAGDAWTGALLAGAVFALLHAPNFELMLLTFAAGTAWAWLGLRDRALLPLAASHWLLGTLVVWVAPPWLLRSAEVGIRFFMPG